MPKHSAVTFSASTTYQEAYLLVNTVLLLPVVLWPFVLLTGFRLDPNVDIVRYWQMASVALLVISTTADSMLTIFADRTHSLYSFTIWVLFVGLLGAWSSNEPDGNFIIGLLFFIQSSRSARKLWRESNDWWLWPAWTRDILASLAVFLWPLYLS